MCGLARSASEPVPQWTWIDGAGVAASIPVRARGEKLPTEFPNSMMRCICGITFDSHKPAENYDHRAHIYAAQDKGLHW
jgi:hypothetical protein